MLKTKGFPMSPIRIYNTLSGSKEDFVPRVPGQVSFYVCGVTAYDLSHIGHGRAYVAFDTMRRYLETQSFDVNYVQNFTDIDDKIINRAHDLGISCDALTEKNIQAYFEDMDRLNVERAKSYPRATQNIPAMVAMIETLITQGHAYELGGDVCFSVETFASYGKLSKKILEDLIAGIRVDISDKKKNPLDFVLWKASKPGEPSWDSPWGKGRPGWHIECSAMVKSTLGETIDIHGGGEDLIFPHHENEIAQSECCNNAPFVRYWIHNGFVTVRNDKMSKSKKNFVTVRELLEKFDGEEVRFYLQKVHYRAPLHFSWDGVKEAKAALDRLYNTLANCNASGTSPDLDRLEKKFFEAMDDDFNYAEAIGVLFEISKFINIYHFGSDVLLRLGKILGLFNRQESTSLNHEIQALVDQRIEARKNKDFAMSDSIRDRLKEEFKIELEDSPQGVKWRRIG